MQKVSYDAVREEWGQVKCNCSHAVFQNAWHSEFLLKHVLQGHIFPLRHLSRPGKGQHDSSRGIDNSRMSHSNSANRLPNRLFRNAALVYYLVYSSEGFIQDPLASLGETRFSGSEGGALGAARAISERVIENLYRQAL